MKCPPVMADEIGRLEALADYGIDNRTPIKRLDMITDIAAKLLDMPMAAVNIIAGNNTFLTSSICFGDAEGADRNISFCAHTIAQDGVMVVHDALQGEWFHDNALVLDGVIRFYAGVPVRSSSGHAPGALCIIDAHPHEQYNEQNVGHPQELARIVEDELELHRLEQALESRTTRLATVGEMSPNAIICFDMDGCITECNQSASAMFGPQAGMVIGKPLDTLIASEDRERVHVALRRVLSSGTSGRASVQMTGLHMNGTQFPIEIFWNSWNDVEKLQFGAIVRDLTERYREREVLHFLTN